MDDNVPPKWSFHFRRIPLLFDDTAVLDASPFVTLDDTSVAVVAESSDEEGATFFNKLEKDDFFESSNLIFLVVGEEDWEDDFSNSRLDEYLSSVGTTLFCGLSFLAFTDLCHAALITLTRSLIAISLGEPAQILCFSIVPITFPRPLSLTTDFVTGNCEILDSK